VVDARVVVVELLVVDELVAVVVVLDEAALLVVPVREVVVLVVAGAVEVAARPVLPGTEVPELAIGALESRVIRKMPPATTRTTATTPAMIKPVGRRGSSASSWSSGYVMADQPTGNVAGPRDAPGSVRGGCCGAPVPWWARASPRW